MNRGRVGYTFTVSLLVLLILLTPSPLLSTTKTAPAQADRNAFKLAWKVPAGILTFVDTSPNADRILLSANYDGYYLYDANGTLLWQQPNPYEGWASFSADGKRILLSRQFTEGRDSLALMNIVTLQTEWNFTLDRLHYAAVSNASPRIAIVGAIQYGSGNWQGILLVTDTRGGSNLLNVTIGRGGYPSPTAPVISSDGRYVAIGDYDTGAGGGGWLYFADVDSQKSWNSTIPEGVLAVAMSADGALAVAAMPDKVEAFNQKGRVLWSAPLPDYPLATWPQSLSISDDGKYLAIAGGGMKTAGYVMMFDSSGKKLWEFHTSSAILNFAADWQAFRFVTGDWDGNLYLLDKSGTLLSKINLISPVGPVTAAGNPPILAAIVYGGGYGWGTSMYVIDPNANILWKHNELGAVTQVAASRDGTRILAGYVGGATLFDREGEKLFSVSTTPSSVASAMSTDGRVFVVSNVTGSGPDSLAHLSWYNISTSRQIRSLALNYAAYVDSLSMSTDGSLVVASGRGVGNFTYIAAFDSQGRQLWIHFDPERQEGGGLSIIESTVATSGDGGYVAAGRRDNVWDPTGHSHLPSAGNNNGIILFDREGNVLWNYTVPDWVWNVAISGTGEYVIAGSSLSVYLLNKAGRLQWSMRVDNGIVAISKTGQEFIAGHYGGGLFLGGANGTYWQTGVDGHAQSVAISDSGNVSAALISRDFKGAVPLLYILDNQGLLLGNFSFTRRGLNTGRLSIAADGCCIVASLDLDGLYYFAASREQNRTATTQTTYTSSAVAGVNEVEAIAIVIVVGAITGAILLLVRARRPRLGSGR